MAVRHQNDKNVFDQIHSKTNVDQDDLFQLAGAVNDADLQNEETVRRLIHDVSRVAGVPVSKEKEEQLVKAILNQDVPLDFNSLSSLFPKD
ncbi:stage VI sporulation protein F [Salsuginibacillus halophilus]